MHATAAGWLAGHGYPVEAVHHAQAAQDWGLAARLLAGQWPGLYLDGQAATVHELLLGFPAETRMADAELAAVAAADELARGSLEAAERYLGLAERAAVPDGRAGQAQLLAGMVRLLLARQRGNRPAVAEEAQRLATMAEGEDAAQPGLGEELRALALISLGSAEYWAAGEDTGRYLERGLTLARRIGRPYLEFTGLAQQAADLYESFTRSAEHARAAVELARRHGWTGDPAFGVACAVLGSVLFWRGQLDEAEAWIQRAERTLRAEAEPAAAARVGFVRGLLEAACGRDQEALAASRAAERPAGRMAAPNPVVPQARALQVFALARLGDTECAAQAFARLADQDRDDGAIRISLATLRLAQDDPPAAIAALAPVLDGSAPLAWPAWLAEPCLLEAIARDALGDPGAAGRALEHALDLAEPDGMLTMFLLHPAPGLLERQARQGTAHAALIAEILSRLAGQTTLPPAGPPPPLEPLSDSEIRVLRYLPTNLTAPEIASELYVSRHTVKTHLRHLYAKLGTHRRADTVVRARALGLLAPSALKGRAKVAG